VRYGACDLGRAGASEAAETNSSARLERGSGAGIDLIGIEPQRTWAVGWGAVPKSDCEPGRVIERPGRVAEPEGRPKPLDVGA